MNQRHFDRNAFCHNAAIRMDCDFVHSDELQFYDSSKALKVVVSKESLASENTMRSKLDQLCKALTALKKSAEVVVFAIVDIDDPSDCLSGFEIKAVAGDLAD